MSKNGLAILCFFVVVVTNVHLSIINSFYMYQTQFSPREDISLSYCPYYTECPQGMTCLGFGRVSFFSSSVS